MADEPATCVSALVAELATWNPQTHFTPLGSDVLYELAFKLARIASAADRVAKKQLVILPVSRNPEGGYKGGWGFTVDYGKDPDMLELALALQDEPPDDGTWNGEIPDGMAR